MDQSPVNKTGLKQRVAVCIPTYQRQQLLHDCLGSIESLRVPKNTEVHIVVVDNDAAGSAKAVVDKKVASSPFSIHYFIEPARGLASVRNRLVEEAIALNSDYFAFIDDDEQASADWLYKHMDLMHQKQADVSCGPVRPVGASLEVKGKKAIESGSVPRHVSTNNVIFSNKLVCSQGLRFDTFYNFIGGEDFDFFERSREMGNRHTWCEEAYVEETITADRDSFTYLFYRHYTGGINAVIRYRKKRSTVGAWFRFLPKSLGKIIGAVFYLLFSLLGIRRAPLAIATKKIGSGIGYIAALMNVSTARYGSDNAEQVRS